MVRTYKRKLILTSEQSSRICSWIGCCRMVYNMGLEIKIGAYKRSGKPVSKYDLMKQLPDLKKRRLMPSLVFASVKLIKYVFGRMRITEVV